MKYPLSLVLALGAAMSAASWAAPHAFHMKVVNHSRHPQIALAIVVRQYATRNRIFCHDIDLPSAYNTHHYVFPKRRSRLYQVAGDTIDYAPNLSPEGYCGWVDSEGSALIEAKENDFKVQVNFNEAPGYDASMTGDTIRCRSAGNSAVNCVSKSRGAVWEPHFHLAPSSKPWQTTFVLE